MNNKSKKRNRAVVNRVAFESRRTALINRYTLAILALIILLHAFVYISFHQRESREIETGAIEKARLYADELIHSISQNSHGNTADDQEKLQNLSSLIRISRFARSEEQMKFRLTSSTPINPENSPGAFETEALKHFSETGENEYIRFEYAGDFPHLNYSKTLVSKPECKSCHEETRFKDGELRGVVSVSLPVNSTLQRFAEKKRFYIWASVTLILAVSLVVLALAYQLGRQIKASYKIEEETSQTDSLTGLANRSFILERLHQETNRAERHDASLSAVLATIDHLGAVNNRHGQKAGDMVLLKLSELISRNLRDYDTVGRYGGEEYLVVLPFTRLEAAREVAERLRADIEKQVILFHGRQIKVSISAGVAQWRGESESVDQLLQRLSVAQYNAQANGRNRVETDDMV